MQPQRLGRRPRPSRSGASQVRPQECLLTLLGVDLEPRVSQPKACRRTPCGSPTVPPQVGADRGFTPEKGGDEEWRSVVEWRGVNVRLLVLSMLYDEKNVRRHDYTTSDQNATVQFSLFLISIWVISGFYSIAGNAKILARIRFLWKCEKSLGSEGKNKFDVRIFWVAKTRLFYII